MTCGNLWAVCGGCCDDTICKAFPTINWQRNCWQVTTPGAIDYEIETASQFRDGLFNWYTWNAVSNALNGWVIPSSEPATAEDSGGTPNVDFSTQQLIHRAGSYRSQHAGLCAWRVYDRERLVPWNLGLLLADKLFSAISYVIFAIGASDIAGPATTKHASWWQIFPELECTFLPALEARSEIANIRDAGPYTPLARLDLVRDKLQTTGVESIAGSEWLICPTVLDLTASFALSPGLLFGVIDDKDSPLHGQLTIWNDATLEAVSGGEPGQQRMTATAWELVSGSAVVAEYGVTNRFERTNANDALPAWVELELIRC